MTDPSYLEDPYATYVELRRSGGLSRGGRGQWVVTRHEDEAGLLRDRRVTASLPEAYHAIPGGDPDLFAFLARVDHARQSHRTHRLLARAYRSWAGGSLARRLGAIFDELLAPALARGSMELVNEVATPFPALAMSEAPLSGRRQ